MNCAPWFEIFRRNPIFVCSRHKPRWVIHRWAVPERNMNVSYTVVSTFNIQLARNENDAMTKEQGGNKIDRWD